MIWMIKGRDTIKHNDCYHWGGLCSMGGFLVPHVVIAGKSPHSRDFAKASGLIIRTAFRRQQCYRSSKTACLYPKPPISSEPSVNHDWSGSLLAYARSISCIEQAGLTSAQLHGLHSTLWTSPTLRTNHVCPFVSSFSAAAKRHHLPSPAMTLYPLDPPPQTPLRRNRTLSFNLCS